MNMKEGKEKRRRTTVRGMCTLSPSNRLACQTTKAYLNVFYFGQLFSSNEKNLSVLTSQLMKGIFRRNPSPQTIA